MRRQVRRAREAEAASGGIVRRLLYLAATCVPLAAAAASLLEVGYAVVSRSGAEGPAARQLLRVREGPAAHELVETLPPAAARVHHLEELEGIVFLIAEGPRSSIGVFRVALAPGRTGVFVDAAAALGGGPLLSESPAALSIADLASEVDPAVVFAARLGRTSAWLGGPQAGLELLLQTGSPGSGPLGEAVDDYLVPVELPVR